MKIALIDNGSLEPEAHEGLRSAAAAIGERAGVAVEAVSWRHSGGIPPGTLQGGPAWTLAPWIRSRVAGGEREFLIVPFFISPQGAVGSALRRDLESLRAETGGIDFSISGGLAPPVLSGIVADRVLEVSRAKGLRSPRVVVVDHGGPSMASGEVRDRVVREAREALGPDAGPMAAASMESPKGPGFEFSRPLLAEALSAPGVHSGDVVVAPLFLLPGRHAGPGGDLERICRDAEARSPGLHCHLTGLVGSHPVAAETLASALAEALRAAFHS